MRAVPSGASLTPPAASRSPQGRLSEAETNLSEAKTAVKTADMKVKHLTKEVKDVEKKYKEVEKSSKSQANDGAALQKEVETLRARMARLPYDESQEVTLGTEQHKQQSEHARLCKEAQALSAGVGGLEFRYTPPSRDFDKRRVKGTAPQGSKPRKEPFDLYRSIWRPRTKWADSRDLYDTDVVKHKRFEADWKRMLGLGIVKWVAWGSMGSVPPSRFFFDSCLRP